MPFQKLFASIADVLHSVPPSTWVTAGAAGFVAFAAGLAFSRGVMQQLVNMISIIIAVYVGWFVFTNRTDVFGSVGTQVNTDRLLLFSGAAGLQAYILCQVGVRMLAAMGILVGCVSLAMPFTPQRDAARWIQSHGLESRHWSSFPPNV